MDWAFSMPSILVNEFRAEDGDIINIYKAEFMDLHIESLELHGCARISKRQEHIARVLPAQEPLAVSGQLVPIENQPKGGILAIFSRYFSGSGQNRTAVVNQCSIPPSKNDWTISTSSRKYITYDGMAITDATKTYGYRNAIISEAANKGVLLSGTLLDNAFGPIERQLEELRRGILQASKRL